MARTPEPLRAPKEDHEPPSHLATRVAVTPPALVNVPLAYRSVPRNAMPSTGLFPGAPVKNAGAAFKPVPRADQELPFHLAIFSAETPARTTEIQSHRPNRFAGPITMRACLRCRRSYQGFRHR